MIRAELKIDLTSLGFLKGSKMNIAIRQAMNKAAAPVKAAVVSAEPHAKGNLRKSTRIRIKFYKRGAGGVWVAVVGPSKAYKKLMRRKARKRRAVKVARREREKSPLVAGRKRRGKLSRRVFKATKITAKTGRKAARTLGRFLKRSKLGKAVKRKIRKARQPKPLVIQPSRYAHLVQWGSKHNRGQHFLESAVAKTKHVFEQIFTSTLRDKIASISSK